MSKQSSGAATSGEARPGSYAGGKRAMRAGNFGSSIADQNFGVNA